MLCVAAQDAQKYNGALQGAVFFCIIHIGAAGQCFDCLCDLDVFDNPKLGFLLPLKRAWRKYDTQLPFRVFLACFSIFHKSLCFVRRTHNCFSLVVQQSYFSTLFSQGQCKISSHLEAGGPLRLYPPSRASCCKAPFVFGAPCKARSGSSAILVGGAASDVASH